LRLKQPAESYIKMKLAIVGSEQQTRHLAPYDNPDYDIWVFNEWANADWCKRWTACLQIHEPQVYQNPNNDKDPSHWEWLQKDHGKTIWMQEIDPRVPNSVKYPKNEIIERFFSGLLYEGLPQKYIRATISYAIALAIFTGYDEVDIYGVELANHAEFRSQRDNFIFWIGVARGAGVKINLHCCKGLFEKPLYGYEGYVQEDEIQRYVEGINQQLEENRSQAKVLEGALMLATQMLGK